MVGDLPPQQGTTKQRWTATLNTTIQAAADSIGYLPHVNHAKVVDAELARLSHEQHRLRQLIYNDHSKDATYLRKQRSRLLHQIRERSKMLSSALIDEKLTDLEQSSESARMFEVT